MRAFIAVAIVLSSVGVARADECYRGPGPYLVCGVEHPHRHRAAVWYETSLGWSQFDLHGYRVDGELLRLGPRVALSSLFYLGAEADFGRVSSANGSSTAPVGRTATSGDDMTSPGSPTLSGIGGSFGAVKVVAGLHANAGIISGAAEFAAGLRLAEINSDATGVITSGEAAALEGRARLDLWLTPRLTIGALAGVDLADHNDVTVALTVGLHFHRFDRVR